MRSRPPPWVYCLARCPHTGLQLESFTVQPDAIITSPSVFCMAEAKRIRQGSFQQNQLARELLVTLERAAPKLPLLLLVLPQLPPVLVRKRGRLSIQGAVEDTLKEEMAAVPDYERSSAETLAAVETTIAYTTWDAISAVVRSEAKSYATSTEPIQGTVNRLAESVFTAKQWHA